MTRQTYRFHEGDLLISHGPELVNPGVPVIRAVTGGTGDYADTAPELVQTLLGMSDGYGLRLQIKFDASADFESEECRRAITKTWSGRAPSHCEQDREWPDGHELARQEIERMRDEKRSFRADQKTMRPDRDVSRDAARRPRP